MLINHYLLYPTWVIYDIKKSRGCMISDYIPNQLRSWNLAMRKRDKEGHSKRERNRLKFLREQKDQRNIAKHNTGFNFPRKRDIEFKDQEKKE